MWNISTKKGIRKALRIINYEWNIWQALSFYFVKSLFQEVIFISVKLIGYSQMK